MNKTKWVASIATAISLSVGQAHAGAGGMEKCRVVDENGEGLIKAHKADCAGSGHSCAGLNKAKDPEAWILVPKGQCEKINAGDFDGVANHIKRKIEGAES